MRRPRLGGLVSSPVSVAAALIVLMFVVAVSYSFYGERGAANQRTAVLDTALVPSDLERAYLDEEDTDGDGMPDWEEIFVGSDPNDASSIAEGAYSAGVGGTVSGSEPEGEVVVDGDVLEMPNSATRVAARELFGSYMYTLTEKTELTEQEQNELVQNALQASLSTIEIPSFDHRTLTTVPVTADAVRAYTLHTKEIFESLAAQAPNEHQLLMQLTQGDRNDAVDQLNGAVELYRSHAQDLALVAVPEDARAMHGALIDSLLKYSFALHGTANLQADPVQAAVTLQLLMQYESLVRHTFAAYGEYITRATENL